MWAKGSWEEPRDQNIQGNSKEMLLPVKFERDTRQCHRHKQSENHHRETGRKLRLGQPPRLTSLIYKRGIKVDSSWSYCGN